MRKYVKPRAKFHELKGTVILAGSPGVDDALIQGRRTSLEELGVNSAGAKTDDDFE